MGKEDVGPIEEMGRILERFAGEAVAKEVMEGSKRIPTASDKEVAEWVKGAMERLDTLVDDETRIRVMENCGYACADMNRQPIDEAIERRRNYEGIDEFLEAEQRNPSRGTRLVREGNVLYQYYTPHTFREGLRCYCSLLRGLPADENISLTYCHCSRGFIKKLWEAVLERPVRVELLQSTVSGAPECKFAIYL